jgi:basic amino acid/polyamine antiporter, APA family
MALRREVGLAGAASVVVGGVVGSGIFFGPQEVALRLPYGEAILGAWALAGVIALLGALSLAELGAALPGSGGYYAWLREAFGPLPAFLSGWSILLTSYGLAPIAMVFGAFAHVAWPLAWGPLGWAWALIAGLTLVNLRGVRESARLQVLTTALKVLALGALVLGAMVVRPAPPPALAHAPLDAGLLLGGLGLALVPALFAYDGWYYAAFLGAEAKDPQRTLPRAIILGTLAVVAVYLAVNAAYVGVLGAQGLAAIAQDPTAQVAGVASPALAVAARALGPAAVGLVVVAVVVSTLGAANSVVLTGPRLYYSMARDGLFFRTFARTHPRWGTPHRATVLQGGIAAVLVGHGTFLQLILITTVGTLIFVGLAVAAVPVLRWKRPAMPRPYRVPLYPWVPLAYLVLTGAVLVLVVLAEPLLLGLFLLANLAGIPAYWAFTRGRPRRARREVVLADLAHVPGKP